jgi:hypothetical protein
MTARNMGKNLAKLQDLITNYRRSVENYFSCNFTSVRVQFSIYFCAFQLLFFRTDTRIGILETIHIGTRAHTEVLTMPVAGLTLRGDIV